MPNHWGQWFKMVGNVQKLKPDHKQQINVIVREDLPFPTHHQEKNSQDSTRFNPIMTRNSTRRSVASFRVGPPSPATGVPDHHQRLRLDLRRLAVPLLVLFPRSRGARFSIIVVRRWGTYSGKPCGASAQWSNPPHRRAWKEDLGKWRTPGCNMNASTYTIHPYAVYSLSFTPGKFPFLPVFFFPDFSDVSGALGRCRCRRLGAPFPQLFGQFLLLETLGRHVSRLLQRRAIAEDQRNATPQLCVRA